jgi:hypothetical protein
MVSAGMRGFSWGALRRGWRRSAQQGTKRTGDHGCCRTRPRKRCGGIRWPSPSATWPRRLADGLELREGALFVSAHEAAKSAHQPPGSR